MAADHGSPLLLRYQVSELTVENTGHVVEVPIPTGVRDTLRLDGDRYELEQYHFHAPSEHAINGRLADVEAHLVHHNAQGATAVVGILFRRGPDPNPLLDKILLSAPATAGEEVHAGDASPAELFDDLRARHGEARRPSSGELLLHLRWLAHDARLHRERAVVSARCRRPGLERRGDPLP